MAQHRLPFGWQFGWYHRRERQPVACLLSPADWRCPTNPWRLRWIEHAL